MDIDEQRDGGATVLAVSGRLDSATAQDLEARLMDALGRGDVEALALDLSELAYVSSAGLRVLLLTAKRAKADATPFTLFGLQPQVAKVLEISGFSRILPIAQDRQAALAALATG